LPAGRTLYHEVVEFPPGTWATFDSDGVQRQGVHFSLLDELCAEAPPAGNRAEALAEAMRDSVRHHFVSDVPVGVFLSAGRDSCTLLGLAAEVVSPTPTAITLQLREFDGTDWDESELAQVAAEHYGAPHRVIPASKSDFEAEFESILAAMDQPSVDGVNVYFISKAAKEAGFKVALSGLGADEIFRGYSSFESVPKLVQATRTASKVPGFGRAVRMVASRTLGGAASPKYASLLEYGGSFGGAYFLRRGLHMPWELSRILDPDFARAGLAELEVVASLNDGLRRVPSSQARMVALESLHYMVPRLLRDADWASMHHSLEIRVPFVDVPLLRTVFAELLRGNAYSKADMAATLALPLPKAILERPKVGFMVPMHAWLQGNEPRKGGGSMRAWARQVYSRFAGVELPRSTG
jgi:asparagine synthase (glutamine-hydrolysing)